LFDGFDGFDGFGGFDGLPAVAAKYDIGGDEYGGNTPLTILTQNFGTIIGLEADSITFTPVYLPVSWTDL